MCRIVNWCFDFSFLQQSSTSADQAGHGGAVGGTTQSHAHPSYGGGAHQVSWFSVGGVSGVSGVKLFVCVCF